jgi:hypothetical protein
MTSQPAVPTPYGSAHDGRPLLVASFRTLEDARDAMSELEAKGIDGDDLVLVGPTAQVAEREALEPDEADKRALSRVTAGVALGIVDGALLGAVVGALVIGAVILLWNGTLTERGLVYGLLVAWFGAAGGLLGAFMGVSRSAGFSDSMELSLEADPDLPACLAVYGPERELRRRRALIESMRPVDITTDAVPETVHPDEATSTDAPAKPPTTEGVRVS